MWCQILIWPPDHPLSFSNKNILMITAFLFVWESHLEPDIFWSLPRVLFFTVWRTCCQFPRYLYKFETFMLIKIVLHSKYASLPSLCFFLFCSHKVSISPLSPLLHFLQFYYLFELNFCSINTWIWRQKSYQLNLMARQWAHSCSFLISHVFVTFIHYIQTFYMLQRGPAKANNS